MRKIKIFRFSQYNNSEEAVNVWLSEHGTAIIHNVLQSESIDSDGSGAWSLTITIFYYEGVE